MRFCCLFHGKCLWLLLGLYSIRIWPAWWSIFLFFGCEQFLRGSRHELAHIEALSILLLSGVIVLIEVIYDLLALIDVILDLCILLHLALPQQHHQQPHHEGSRIRRIEIERMEPNSDKS